MFGWFAPKLPLSTWEKTWTETRMRWLAEQFGIERLLRADVILPTEDFFPDPYDGAVEDVRRLMERVQRYMGFDFPRIGLEVCQDFQMPGAGGHYDRGQPGERTVIRVAESQLSNPESLIAVLAHELSHELLLGRGLLAEEAPDHEWVTDLLPAYLGIGVFAANSSLVEQQGHGGGWSWWVVGKQGYLPARIFGYAMALFAFMRGEQRVAWSSHLRPDAAEALQAGLRYLRKTGDSLFHPDTFVPGTASATADDLLDHLGTGSATLRLSAIWQIRDRALRDERLVTALIRSLDDKDPDIAAETASLLGSLGPAAAGAVPRLKKSLWHGDDAMRAAAALALAHLQSEDIIGDLGVMLREKSSHLVTAAAEALARFGSKAAAAVPVLLEELQLALVECDDVLTRPLAATLAVVAPDASVLVRRHFSDPELRRRALEEVKEAMAAAPSPGQPKGYGDTF